MFKNIISLFIVTLFISYSGLSFAQPTFSGPGETQRNSVPKPAKKIKIKCELIVTKPVAWRNYDVTIKMLNYSDKKVVEIFNLKATKDSKKSVNSITKIFDCYKYQYVQFTAQFLPIIWSTNKGKIYPSRHIYRVAGELLQADKLTKKLVFLIHFPDDFISVPALIAGEN